MIQEKNDSRQFWATVLAVTFISNLVALWWTVSRAGQAGIVLQRSVWGGMLLVYFSILVICIWLFLRVVRSSRLPFSIPSYFASLKFDTIPWRALGLVTFIVILFLIPYVKFNYQIGQTVKKPVYDPIMLLILYYWMCWWAILLAMAALKVAFQTSWLGGFASALVILGVAYEILIRFNAVTTYPLSMGWSEGSRYY